MVEVAATPAAAGLEHQHRASARLQVARGREAREPGSHHDYVEGPLRGGGKGRRSGSGDALTLEMPTPAMLTPGERRLGTPRKLTDQGPQRAGGTAGHHL